MRKKLATKTSTITARISPELKSEVDKIFKNLGLNASEAIKLFYSQVKLHQGIPFLIKIPNQTTKRTFSKTDKGKELIECKDANDMFNKLKI